MKNQMVGFSRMVKYCAGSLLVLASSLSQADQVTADDLIVQGSACVGLLCVNGEDFGFDTIRLKGDSPQILFNDTSSAGSFPSNDWRMGLVTNVDGQGSDFFIKDETGSTNVLYVTPGSTGSIALGAGSSLEAGAVSVGSSGSERRVMHVADGTDDHDAVTVAQFNTFTTTAQSGISADVTALNTRIDNLTDRLNALADRIAALEP